MRGRPLRFLILVIGGWSGARAVVLWGPARPDAPVVAASRAAVAEGSVRARGATGPTWRAAAVARDDPAPTGSMATAIPVRQLAVVPKPADAPAASFPPQTIARERVASLGATTPPLMSPPAAPRRAPAAMSLALTDPVPHPTPTTPPTPAPAPDPAPVSLALVDPVPHPAPTTPPMPTPAAASPPQATPAIVAPVAAAPVPAGPSRLAGSAYLFARGGRNGTVTGGQLGASQAGARLTYALDEGRRFALSARYAAPLAGRGQEAALGVDWRPFAFPLHLLVEQRFALDGQKGGPSAMLVGGYGPAAILPRLWLEGYAQAGVIHRDRLEAFGDGAVRLTTPLRGPFAGIGPARLDLGLGAWGAAQRGVRRLDLGPTLGLRLPVAKRSLRVTLDWRQRVAGRARPGSGPALSIGTDF